MNPKTPILELPLHLVGISDQVTNWLREAGFPVIPLGQDSPWKTAFRRKNSAPKHADEALKRCLLFDSRDVWSRAVVKTHQKNSLAKLDISRLLGPLESDSKPESKSIRSAFLEKLKGGIESLGGVWVRLADLPFPYQSIGCLNGNLPHAGLPRKTSGNQASRVDVIQQRYMAGLPSSIVPEDLSELDEIPPVTGLQSPGMPLLWRVDQTAFTEWWNYRNHLQVRVLQSPAYYKIDCPYSNTKYCPVLEIWRGNHLASVPLRSESLIVRKDGLVFQQQPLRHPAGFTTNWPDNAADVGFSNLSA